MGLVGPQPQKKLTRKKKTYVIKGCREQEKGRTESGPVDTPQREK